MTPWPKQVDKSMNEALMHSQNLTVHTFDTAILEAKTGGTLAARVAGR